MQIKRKIGNIWEHKVGINANIANLMCLWKTRIIVTDLLKLDTKV